MPNNRIRKNIEFIDDLYSCVTIINDCIKIPGVNKSGFGNMVEESLCQRGRASEAINRSNGYSSIFQTIEERSDETEYRRIPTLMITWSASKFGMIYSKIYDLISLRRGEPLRNVHLRKIRATTGINRVSLIEHVT